eukprot:72508-Pelagomonas_calceolata.AAC.1
MNCGRSKKETLHKNKHLCMGQNARNEQIHGPPQALLQGLGLGRPPWSTSGLPVRRGVVQ